MTDRHDRQPFENFDSDSFVDGVLGRTSGSACERAATQLGALMANRLQGMDRHLVQAHLENCPGCRDLAVTMGWLTPLLPRMAEIDPGPEFLAGVLSRTSQARHPALAGSRPTGAAGLMDRLGRWWEKQILRPQFAMQAAYAATVLVVILTALPVSPLREVPKQALEVVTAGPRNAPLVGPAVVQIGEWVDDKGARIADQGRARAETRWSRIQDDLSGRAERTSNSRAVLGGHWHNLVMEIRARNLGGAGYEILAALKSGQEVWQQWWHGNEDKSGT